MLRYGLGICTFLLCSAWVYGQRPDAEWEYATVRVLRTYQERAGGTATTEIAVCREGAAGCKETQVPGQSKDWLEVARDQALIAVLNQLGRDGFEVAVVLPARSDVSSAAVLLKRRKPTP